MKNIAIVVPTLNRGGAERVAANMSLAFEKRHHVYLIVFDGSDVVYPCGGELIDLQLPPAGSFPGKVHTLLKRTWALRKLKRKLKIDIAISHLPAANYANVFSGKCARVWTYVHCMEELSLTMRVRERLVASLSDKMICVSECVRRNMEEQFGIAASKLDVMYNFCDLEAPAIRNAERKTLTVVTMGRLTRQKGQRYLIRAMSRVIERIGQNVRLVMIGEGELREPLEWLAEEMGIRENVCFTGFLPEPWELLAGADVYVSSSLWEGLPMSLVEAGRCGLPIVSTDCDAGCREILAPDTEISRKTECAEYAAYGVLVPVCRENGESSDALTREEEVLADSIVEMLCNESLRCRYAERARLRSEDFRFEKLMEKWEKLMNAGGHMP